MKRNWYDSRFVSDCGPVEAPGSDPSTDQTLSDIYGLGLAWIIYHVRRGSRGLRGSKQVAPELVELTGTTSDGPMIRRSDVYSYSHKYLNHHQITATLPPYQTEPHRETVCFVSCLLTSFVDCLRKERWHNSVISS